MSVKAAYTGLLRKGKQVLQTVLKTKTQKVPVKIGDARHHQQIVHFRQIQQGHQDRFQGLFRRVIPNIYFNSLARELSRKAALRGGRNVPVLAFMGFVLTNAAEQEEEGGISARIQNFMKASGCSDSPLPVRSLSLDQFQFGQMIGQGCNAAVYEARFKDAEDGVSAADDDSRSDITVLDDSDADLMESETQYCCQTATVSEMANTVSEVGSDITVLTDDEDDWIENSENTEECCQIEIVQDIPDTTSDSGSDFSFLAFSDDEVDESERAPLVFYVDSPETRTEADSDIEVLSDAEVDISEEVDMEEANFMSCSKNVLSAGLLDMQLEEDTVPPDIWEEGSADVYNSLDSSVSFGVTRPGRRQRFNLAVKMMFNYDAESNAASILRQMDKETLPARVLPMVEQIGHDSGNGVKKLSLPPHPNIVEMWGVFVDPVPQLPDGVIRYPAALPSRINPAGAGRNMTLFLVMKKYSMTLDEYLSLFPTISIDERLILLTQLLEAVAHLRKHGIAHRDIKADNILLDMDADGPPRVVLTDFGCCLADAQNGLKIPFQTDEIDRGGNTALMAPEIACAVPGMFSKLDYRKSDLWSVGAIAYQILGADNPFYGQATLNRLDSRTYREAELPALPEDTPVFVQKLVRSLLSREPKQRPTPRLAADLLHLYLWSPSKWQQLGTNVQRSEMDWWLVTMAAEVMMEKQLRNRNTTKSTMKRSFLESFNMNNMWDCLSVMAVSCTWSTDGGNSYHSADWK